MIKGDDAKPAERIAKVMARAGLGSRRQIETWIHDGRVGLNGTLLSSPAIKVSQNDHITLDGKPIAKPERSKLWLYHKPRGLVVSRQDEKGRAVIFDHLPADMPRVISVGRLDIESEGLLLLTNDGALARYLEHPDQGLKRTYRVRAFGAIPNNMEEKLAAGMMVDGVRYRPVGLTILPNSKAQKGKRHDNHWLEIALYEGKNREIRKLLTHFDLQVSRLIRTGYGEYQLGSLPKGAVKTIKNPKIAKKTQE